MLCQVLVAYSALDARFGKLWKLTNALPEV
jgi:hypothetical protein